MKPNSNGPIYCFLKNILVCLFYFLIGSMGVMGQSKLHVTSNDTLILNGKVPNDKIVVVEYFKSYYDSTNQLTFQQISQKTNFKAVSRNQSYNVNTTWLRLSVKNIHPTDTLSMVLFLREYKIVEVHELNDLGIHHQKTDWFAWGAKSVLDTRFEIGMKIPPRKNSTYFIKATNFIFFGHLPPTLFSENSFQKQTKDPKAKFLNAELFGFLCMIIGLCFFLGLFACVQW